MKFIRITSIIALIKIILIITNTTPINQSVSQTIINHAFHRSIDH